jgi:hypothetical protein
MIFRASILQRFVSIAGACLLTGCVAERWSLSTASHPRAFEVRKPSELFEQTASPGPATNRLLYVEPAANLVDYAYSPQRRALEISVQVNRDQTVTVAGPHAGSGKQIKIRNFKYLSPAVRLEDSTGWSRIGAAVSIPTGAGAAEEQKLTLLLGLLLEESTIRRAADSPNQELAGTLVSVIIYDYGRDLILAEWTREREVPPPAQEPPTDTEPNG